MNIFTSIKKSFTPRKFNYELFAEKFFANRVRKGALTPAEVAHYNLCVLLMEHIETTLLPESHILHLSNDVELGKVLDCSEHQAKRAKQKLSKLGIIYVPAWAKQKKEGDHPIWLVWLAFMDKVEEFVANFNKKPRKKNFVQKYYTLYNLAKKRVREWFEEEEKEYGETVNLHISTYMRIVQAEFSEILEARGLTRAALRR